MSNIAKVLKWIREVDINSLPYSIRGLGWGRKISNGFESDKYSLIFYVHEKKRFRDLDPQEVIPKYLDIEGVNVLTDVQVEVMYETLVGDCHTISTSPTAYDPGAPISEHRLKHRPLRPGISTINIGSSDATLGLFVRDKTDGSVVALSNNHVYSGTQVSARTGRWLNGAVGAATSSTIDIKYRANVMRLSAIQPALSAFNPNGADVGIGEPQERDCIGTCKRGVPIGNVSAKETFGGFVAGPGLRLFIDRSSCDAAIVELSSYNLLGPSSNSVVNFSQPGPYQFATDEEIDSLLDPESVNYGSPVFRGGRTCGPVGFPGYTNSCNLSVSEFGAALVGYFSTHYVSTFTDSFIVEGDVVPGRGGDSGSAFFALLSSTVPAASAWKCIGLLFAGPQSPFPDYSIGCRITNIVRDLGIAPWDGTIPTLSTSKSFVELSNIFTPIVELSGRKYYQLGLGVQS
jgi:hypothetical protein